MRVSRQVSICVCILIVMTAAASPLEPEDVRTGIVDKIRAIQSFAVTYHLTAERDGVAWLDRYDEIRFDGNSVYARQRGGAPENSGAAGSTFDLILARVDGLTSSLHLHKLPPTGVIGSQGNQGSDPIEMYFTPFRLMGSILADSTIDDYLSQGDLTLVDQPEAGGGTLKATRWDRGVRYAFDFDAEFRLTAIRMAEFPPGLDEVQRIELGDNLEEHSRLILDVRIDEYQKINGVDFPVRGHQTTRILDWSEIHVLRDEYQAGRMSETEYFEKAFKSAPLKSISTSSLTMVEPVQVNIPLTAKDFEIEYPDGTLIWDHGLGAGFTVGDNKKLVVHNVAASLADAISEPSQGEEVEQPALDGLADADSTPRPNIGALAPVHSSSISRARVATYFALGLSLVVVWRVIAKRRENV